MILALVLLALAGIASWGAILGAYYLLLLVVAWRDGLR